MFGFYIALLPGLGFRIATFLFVLALASRAGMAAQTEAMAACGRSRGRHQLVCHFVFEDYLSVLLPRGTWSGM